MMNRKAMSGLATGVILVILAFSLFGSFMVYNAYYPIGPHSTTTGPTSVTSTPISSGVCQAPYVVKNVAIKFIFSNSYGGAAYSTITAGIVSILDSHANYGTYEDTSSGTVATNAWTTSKTYTSGDTWTMNIVSTDHTKSQFTFTVPCETDINIATHTVNIWVIPYPDSSGVGMSVLNPANVAIATGGNYNVTTSGVAKPSFSITIVNKDDNTGWSGNSGIINNVNSVTGSAFQDKRTFDTVLNAYRTLDLVFVDKVTVASGSPASLVLNMPQIYARGVNAWYGQSFTSLTAAGAAALDRYKLPSGTYAQGKTGSFGGLSLQVDSSGMAAGATENEYLYVYFYGDLKYLAQYGTINSEAVAGISAFQIIIYK